MRSFIIRYAAANREAEHGNQTVSTGVSRRKNIGQEKQLNRAKDFASHKKSDRKHTNTHKPWKHAEISKLLVNNRTNTPTPAICIVTPVKQIATTREPRNDYRDGPSIGLIG